MEKKEIRFSGAQTKNCKKCGRTFLYYGIGHMYCPECTAIDNEIFKRVKEYIYSNGPANATEVSEGTGVSLKQIQLYLKEGRLEVPENSKIFIKCEKCGIDMRSGRFCPLCASKLNTAFISGLDFDNNEIGEVAGKKMSSTNGKMHFLSKFQ